MNLVTFIKKIMASKIFTQLFPCNYMKCLKKVGFLKFVNQSTNLKASQRVVAVSSAGTPKDQKYRCRDVVKLMHMNDKYKLIQPGYKVLDIGAAPGSWSQFLAKETNSNKKDTNAPVGLVVAIDVNDFERIEGVHSLPKMDFMKESSQIKIGEILGRGKKFDFIFSDMEPPTCGLMSFDKERMIKSILCIFLFMVKHLKTGGSCLIKIQGAENRSIVKQEAKKLFSHVNFPLANVSATSLPDMYFMGRGFLGKKT